MSDTATIPNCTGCGLSGGVHYVTCAKTYSRQYSLGLEQGRAEMREVMECGHNKVCRFDYSGTPEGMEGESFGVSYPADWRCSACARERRIKELIEKWRDPEFWKDEGAAMDSHDCADELERAINPDDIKVK